MISRPLNKTTIGIKGEQSEFTCVVKSRPASKIRWQINEKFINQSRFITKSVVETERDIFRAESTLKITRVEMSDKGTIKCIAEFPNGYKVNSETHLVVYCKYSFFPGRRKSSPQVAIRKSRSTKSGLLVNFDKAFPQSKTNIDQM